MAGGREHASGSGAFVYTGSGKKQSADASPCQRLCVKEARDIQYCLAKNGYNERWCQRTIAHWQRCCDTANAAAGSLPTAVAVASGTPVASGKANPSGSFALCLTTPCYPFPSSAAVYQTPRKFGCNILCYAWRAMARRLQRITMCPLDVSSDHAVGTLSARARHGPTALHPPPLFFSCYNIPFLHSFLPLVLHAVGVFALCLDADTHYK